MVAVEVCTGEVSDENFTFLTFPGLEQTFTGNPPFLTNFHAAILDILNGKRPPRPAILRHEGLWEVMKRCWSAEPRERPTTSQLLQFFQTS